MGRPFEFMLTALLMDCLEYGGARCRGKCWTAVCIVACSEGACLDEWGDGGREIEGRASGGKSGRPAMRTQSQLVGPCLVLAPHFTFLSPFSARPATARSSFQPRLPFRFHRAYSDRSSQPLTGGLVRNASHSRPLTDSVRGPRSHYWGENQ